MAPLAELNQCESSAQQCPHVMVLHRVKVWVSRSWSLLLWKDPSPSSFHHCKKELLSVELLPQLGFPAHPPWAGRGRKTFTCCSLPGRGHHEGNGTQASDGSFFGWISVCLLGWGCSWLSLRAEHAFSC